MDLRYQLLRRRADRLLAPWRHAGRPGASIGVVLGGELVIHQSAGMASIELALPIGDETTFRIASVSKQFTCAAVILLAAESKLSVNDDVRDHLSGFPDLGHRLTLDHLMHNTSGIRDMLEIMRLGGVDLSQPCEPQDLFEGVCRQRGLNFPPGSRYLYSNSNFMLLGRIVEQVTGEPFRRFLDHRIFAPLGMNATSHVERTNEIVPNLATGYLPAHNGWIRAQHGFPLHGEGGLVSSVTDLALWHANIASPRVGGMALTDALSSMAPFTNGHPNTYARGLRIRTYRGVRTIGHDGLWPGYKTCFVRIPDYDAAVICISNDGSSDPHDLAFQMVDGLIEDKPEVHPVPPMPANPPSSGRYLNRESAATVELGIDKPGRRTATTHGVTFPIVPTTDGRFTTSRGSGDFTIRVLSDDAVEVERDAGIREILHRTTTDANLPDDLVGRYVNPEIAAAWTITRIDKGMIVQVAGPLRVGVSWEIEPIEDDCIRIVTPSNLFRAWLDVRILRDDCGTVSGLHVDGGRARGLIFAREDGE
jgi:D-aminopeptidase